ncbi:MAG: hypothetical protein MJ211_10015 [Bacteroidales bacterium]|nr:hypothetical protein [Bacteroidales bacterium]
MIKLRNIHTGLIFDYEDEAGKSLAATNKFDFEIVDATEEIKKEIEEMQIPTDEALILGKRKRKKTNG